MTGDRTAPRVHAELLLVIVSLILGAFALVAALTGEWSVTLNNVVLIAAGWFVYLLQ